MKNLVLSLTLILALCCQMKVAAQGRYTLFDYEMSSANGNEYKIYEESDVHSDYETDFNRAPVGGGLLILGGLAICYAIRKQSRTSES